MAEKYLPLYRKYRPTNFHEVVGQEVVVKTLLNAIEHNRVAHAYLFCGPRGTGKTSIARIFAKTLNCQNPTNGEPCLKCPHCEDMNNTIPMDVIEIDAASNRSVEDARNLLEKVQYTPVLGKNKIYIIDEVHMLTKEAFNTLLKTLEEPPENLIFILATTEAHKVLETIVSRCQKFDFKRISVEDIKNRLTEIAKKENINIEDNAVEFIARRSAGGLRDALALLDQSTVLALDNKAITKKDIVTLLGSVDDNDLYNLADLIAKKNPNDVISVLKNIVDKGNDPHQVIKELIGYFRNLMLASVCKTKEDASNLLDISVENCERILTQSKEFSSQELVQIIEQLAEQEKNVRNSSNPYLWLDVAVINAATRENITAQNALLERIENLEKRINAGFQPKTQPLHKTEIQIKQVKTQEPPEEIPVQIKPNEVISDSETSAKEPEIKKIETKEEIINEEKEEKQENIKSLQEETLPNEKISNTPLVELNWDTFLGEVQANPALYALLKSQAKPIITNSDKIELAFRNEIFVDKIKQKQQFLQDIAKKLCGTIPKMIFRKISEEDFKKKPLNNRISQSEPNIATPEPIEPVAEQEDVTPTVEEIHEVKADLQTKSSNKEDLSFLNLPDEEKQILEIFSGKFIS